MCRSLRGPARDPAPNPLPPPPLPALGHAPLSRGPTQLSEHTLTAGHRLSQSTLLPEQLRGPNNWHKVFWRSVQERGELAASGRMSVGTRGCRGPWGRGVQLCAVLTCLHGAVTEHCGAASRLPLPGAATERGAGRAVGMPGAQGLGVGGLGLSMHPPHRCGQSSGRRWAGPWQRSRRAVCEGAVGGTGRLTHSLGGGLPSRLWVTLSPQAST